MPKAKRTTTTKRRKARKLTIQDHRTRLRIITAELEWLRVEAPKAIAERVAHLKQLAWLEIEAVGRDYPGML